MRLPGRRSRPPRRGTTVMMRSLFLLALIASIIRAGVKKTNVEEEKSVTSTRMMLDDREFESVVVVTSVGGVCDANEVFLGQ